MRARKKTMNEKKQTASVNIHESLYIALILALLGGFLDSYTFILKNGVFANAQTGNLILLSISLFNGEFGRVPRYLLQNSLIHRPRLSSQATLLFEKR